jgi:hypothetical protein
MGHFVGGAPGGIVANATASDPKGSVFPHLRLPPSGPVIPGSSVIDVRFGAAFGVTPFDLVQLPFAGNFPTEANQLTAALEVDTDAIGTGALSISFLGMKVGVILQVWYSFGFIVPAGESGAVVQTVMAIDGVLGKHVLAPPASPNGGLIQTYAVTESTGAPTTVTGSGMVMIPVVAAGDYEFIPLAYASDALDTASMVPATNEVSLMGIAFGIA